MPRYLIIQTAFLGDVVLALPVAQRLKALDPAAEVHWVVRHGNEGLLAGHPAAQRVFVWDKRRKYASLVEIARQLRAERYDAVFNLQRFANSGLLTLAARSAVRVGFAKNPISALFTHRLPHVIPDPAALRVHSPLLSKEGLGVVPVPLTPPTPPFVKGVEEPHEVDRNLSLLHPVFPQTQTWPRERPRLYPSAEQHAKVAALTAERLYVVVAPASVWFTKQWPAAQWRRMIEHLPVGLDVHLVGAPNERALADEIAAGFPQVRNQVGQLSLLETAALMAGARRVFANDSAPLHLASAVNAPTTAVFCNTVPAFGFGPLADEAMTFGVPDLPCRPCHLTGRKACPLGHFQCAWGIDPSVVAGTAIRGSSQCG